MKLEEILISENIVESINNNIDYLLIIIPELSTMFGFDQMHPHHHLDLWNHTLYALSLSENDFDVRLALLLHDIGKSFDYKEIDGVRHYPNHAIISANIAKNILNRLNYDDEYISKIEYLIRYHDYPISKNEISLNKELLKKRFNVQIADAFAHNPNKLDKRLIYIYKVQEYFKEESIDKVVKKLVIK